MSDDLTLPGDLPGLLRRGSPVVALDGVTGVVLGIGANGEVSVGWLDDWSMERGPLDKLGLRLDLTDPTGCVHAAWWAVQALIREHDGVIGYDDDDAVKRALHGVPMTDADIATLRDLCLRLAGRTP